jgi:Zn-dependent protease/predicted transcriptional regulator
MKWAVRIARISGIDIRVHATFAIALLIGALQAGHHFGIGGAWFGVVLVSSLFLCITLHELGHSLVAQRCGVEVREIVLLPIGGMARLGSEPKKPLHELLIAVAGPLVNLLIAGLLLPFIPHGRMLQGGAMSLGSEPSLPALLTFLFAGNLILAAFNMIPALPMDGGRVLRALLSFPLGKARATRISATIGQIIAAGFVWLGFTGQGPMLVLIGVFVFMAAAQERTHATAGEALSDLRAGEVCDSNAVAFSADEGLGNAVDTILRSHQTQFAVVYGQRVMGVISRDDILRAVPRLGLRAPVAMAMRREFEVIDPELPLDVARAKIMENNGRPLVVMTHDPDQGAVLLGVLAGEDLLRISALTDRLARAGIRRTAAEVAPQRS